MHTRSTAVARLAPVLLLAACAGAGHGAAPTAPEDAGRDGAVVDPPGEVPGRWGLEDTTDEVTFLDCADPYVFDDHRVCWAGAPDARAQWFKIFPSHVDPANDHAWAQFEHAKGEPPSHAYYLWHYDRPLPAGTRVLVEGDFPHARFFQIGFAAPSRLDRYPPPAGWPAVRGDGTGLPEVVLTDQDIVPDPGSVNPFRPGADRTAARRHYHVTFELLDGDPTRLNVVDGVNAHAWPYRAPGNLRIGGTRKVNANSERLDPRTGEPLGPRGPYAWVRIYLPDGGDPFGGVAPPLIRLQFPGQQPVLAPISREMELSELALLPPYAIEDNPALGDALGRSRREVEAHRELTERSLASLLAAPDVGVTPHRPTRQLFSQGADEGPVWFRTFNSAYHIAFMQGFALWRFGQASDASLAHFVTRTLPDRYFREYGMGPGLTEPRGASNNSGHNVQNTYMTAAVSIGRGELLVLRGRLPRTPRTLGGDALATGDEDLRYWNLTLQGGGTGGGTRAALPLVGLVDVTDEDVVTDADGRYLVAIGLPEDRPPSADAAHGVTWRNWPRGNRLTAQWRLTETDDRWAHGVGRIGWAEGDYALGEPIGSAATQRALLRERLGPHYPRAAYVRAVELERAIAAGEHGVGAPDRLPDAREPPGGRGAVRVSVRPAELLSGAAYRVDFGTRRPPGEVFAASVGAHLVDFVPVDGWVTPHPRRVEVTPGGVDVEAVYRPTTGVWRPGPCVGAGCFAAGSVERLVATAGGLCAIGGFEAIGGVPAARVACFDAGGWRALGAGLDAPGEGLVWLGGSLYAGGSFESPGRHVARWDGAAWQPLGAGTDAPVRVLHAHDGALIVGGEFTRAGGAPAARVARVRDGTWEALGEGMDAPVLALASYAGELVAAGEFTRASGVAAAHVARWTGSAWAPLGAGLDAPVHALAVFDGELVASGDFRRAGDAEAHHVARWDGTRWAPLGEGVDGPALPFGRALVVWDDRLVVAGNFLEAGGVSARRVAAWDGAAWAPLGEGLSNWVETLAVYEGALVAGGWFNESAAAGPLAIGRWLPR